MRLNFDIETKQKNITDSNKNHLHLFSLQQKILNYSLKEHLKQLNKNSFSQKVPCIKLEI